MYADAEAALTALMGRYNVTDQQIVVYGHSLGTAASIRVAQNVIPLAGLILISPFTSGIRIFFPRMPFTWCFDCFPNIDRIRRVWCCTLIIEAGDDEVFGINNGHAAALHRRLLHSVQPLSIAGKHNEIEEFDACLERLEQFITQEAGPVAPPEDGLFRF
uniref:Hydrolase_4 domain-containing protein n=1 Tax=Panagrellus redivivus TaxID=6233 RepID=A0A7E4VAI6_PANRE